jgi:hypothetical protein
MRGKPVKMGTPLIHVGVRRIQEVSPVASKFWIRTKDLGQSRYFSLFFPQADKRTLQSQHRIVSLFKKKKKTI